MDLHVQAEVVPDARETTADDMIGIGVASQTAQFTGRKRLGQGIRLPLLGNDQLGALTLQIVPQHLGDLFPQICGLGEGIDLKGQDQKAHSRIGRLAVAGKA
jgi:hypothetical protein